jgi:hypothetical protein
MYINHDSKNTSYFDITYRDVKIKIQSIRVINYITEEIIIYLIYKCNTSIIKLKCTLYY